MRPLRAFFIRVRAIGPTCPVVEPQSFTFSHIPARHCRMYHSELRLSLCSTGSPCSVLGTLRNRYGMNEHEHGRRRPANSRCQPRLRVVISDIGFVSAPQRTAECDADEGLRGRRRAIEARGRPSNQHVASVDNNDLARAKTLRKLDNTRRRLCLRLVRGGPCHGSVASNADRARPAVIPDRAAHVALSAM